jgi:acetyl esterase
MSYIDEQHLDPTGAPKAPGYTTRASEPRSFAEAHAWSDHLDGDMKRVIDALGELGGLPIETLTAEVARLQPTPADAARTLLRKAKLDRIEDLGVPTKDITIQGAAGSLRARLYGIDEDRKSSDKLKPVVVYWHGGGFVIADIDVYDASPRAIARFDDCIVISCEYRQAPENKFPAAHDDAFAAYQWVLANAPSFGGDPAKVAVMGESAGGNLAANVAISARDQGVPAPVYQVLVYPVAGNDMNTSSYQENADAKPLNKAMMKWFVEKYLADPSQVSDPRINLLAANLSGLPNATIVSAEIDPLRSEGEAFSDKLKSAGSEVRHHTFKGVTHEFFGMGLVVKDAAAAGQMVAHNLKRAFGTAILPI